MRDDLQPKTLGHPVLLWIRQRLIVMQEVEKESAGEVNEVFRSCQ
jgi:hypothetical protein